MTIRTLITTYPVCSRKIVGILGSELPGRLFDVIVRNTTIDRRTVIEYATRSPDSGGSKTQTNSLFPQHISGESNLIDNIQSYA
jgi:hypothetical protein